MHNAQAMAVATEFRAKRGALLAVLGQVPLDDGVRRRAAAYLETFFADIADDGRMAAKVLRGCTR